MKKYFLAFTVALVPLTFFGVRMFAQADLPVDYEEKTAAEKVAYLWDQKVARAPYASLPELTGDGWGSIGQIVRSGVNLALTFDANGDELPFGRVKIIHTYGSAVKIRFVPQAGSPFTGVFKGADGIARLSLALPPSKGAYTPGIALKFFRSKLPSVNIVSMNSVDGQGQDHNFFAREFSNQIPKATGFKTKAAEIFFKWVKNPPNRLTLDHLATHGASGVAEASPRAPAKWILVPHRDVAGLISSDSANDFRDELARIPAGSFLYEVYAEAEGGTRTLIGRIRTESQFVASEYADYTLFFKHQRDLD